MVIAESSAAKFVTKNFPSILGIAKSAYDSADSTIQIALRTAYTEYITDTYQKYAKSRSFFIRDVPVGLYEYYVPACFAIGSNKTLSEPQLSDCLEISNRLVIAGTAGSGKSVFIKHLFLNCVDSEALAPILIELRDLNERNCSLSELISSTLSSFNFKTTPKYIEKANKAGHFCYILDGYDEVDFDKRNSLIKEISRLSSKYPSCPIILSSRPEEDLESLQEFTVLNIQPLNLGQAQLLVNKLPVDADVKRRFCNELREGLFESRNSFLSNPLLLSIMLLTYGENAEIPQKKSIFYSQAFDALFRRHDANKGAFRRNRKSELDSLDFSRVFSMFSLQTYEKREFKLSKIQCLTYLAACKEASGIDFKPEDLLQDLMKAFCLLIDDGLEIAYTHRSFQEYFVALHISMSPPEVQKELIMRYRSKMRSDDVIDLLDEINPELVERMLYIPTLEKVFNEAQIKKIVTPAAAIRYMKRRYKSINVQQDTINFSSSGDDIEHRILIKLVNRNKAYKMPDKEYFNEFMIKLRSELNLKEDEVFIEKKINSTSKVTLAVVSGKGLPSTAYLQAAMDAYSEIREKHSQTLTVMKTLLGIRK